MKNTKIIIGLILGLTSLLLPASTNPSPLKLKLTPPKIKLSAPTKTGPELFALKNKKVIKPFLNIQLIKYPEPDGSGYFKIVLTPNNNSKKIKTFDRDIVFLIDTSASIASSQLDEFKAGIASSLQNLKPNDRFEIVAFGKMPTPIFSKLEPTTQDNIEKSKSFLNNLKSSGSTNLYKTLNSYITQNHNNNGRATIIFILTDGKFNAGEITENQKLIDEITKTNHLRNKNTDTRTTPKNNTESPSTQRPTPSASIFVFTNSKKPNATLLSSLAYENGGKFVETQKIDESSKILKKLIYSTSNLVLKNLNYKISKSVSKSTNPKKISDLYLNQSITLTGHYKRNTKNISLTITGTDKYSNQLELIYKQNLNK